MPGTVAHAYNPSTWGGSGRRMALNPGGGGCGEPRSCHCTPVWVTAAKFCLIKKQTKKESSILASFKPVIPATREAEAGELPEPRR